MERLTKLKFNVKIKNLLLGLFALATTVITAQNNLIVFTQESKPFYVVLNGIRQNYTAETNVKIENLPGDFYRIKVIFDDEKYEPVEKSVSFMEKNQQVSMELKYKKGKFKMKYAGVIDIDNSQTEQSANNQETETNSSTTTENNTEESSESNSAETESSSEWVVPYHEEEWSEDERQDFEININISAPGFDSGFESTQSGSTTISSSTTTSTSSSPTSGQQNIDREVYYKFISNGSLCNSPDVNDKAFLDFKYAIEDANMFNRQEEIIAYFKNLCMLSSQVAGIINIDYSTVDAKTIAKEGYRYTYDTENYYLVLDALSGENDRKDVVNFLGLESSESPYSYAGDINHGENDNSENYEETDGSSSTESQVNYSLIPSYSGYVNCNSGSLISDIDKLVSSVKNESFADDKLNIIKQATKNKCLRVSDIELILNEFSHSSDKMEFLKWAWDKTYDIDQFFKLSSSLTFSGDKEELDEFIDEQPSSNFSYVYSTENSEGTLIDADDLESRMDDESFADDKMKLIKQALVSRYISVEQIKQLAPQFSHESDLMEFIEMAYPRTIDTDEFYTLNEILTFSSSKDKLNELMGE